MAKKAKKRGPVASRRTSITIRGTQAKRGEKMSFGRYRLLALPGKRVFVGTLIHTINRGKFRLAMFSVPKG